MSPYEEYLPGMEEPAAEMGAGIILFMMVYMFIAFAVSIVFYVLQSLGYYTKAKNRGIKNAWLAWIPVGSSWIMGCISDQYQYVAKGRVRNKRKAMLVLSILTAVCGVAIYIGYIALIVKMIIASDGATADPDAMMAGFGGSVLLTMLAALVMFGLALALAVLQYISLYDLFASSDPKNAVLYIVLSIVFNVTLPFFVFSCRNKDLGMPPRREPEQPVRPLQEPWENSPEA